MSIISSDTTTSTAIRPATNASGRSPGSSPAQAQRPSDLAARYGGEEFVLLLPGTDAAGCEQVGERIRQALHDLRLPHAANPPSRCVTISLGGATGWPGTGNPADHASLVAAADRALYAAKSLGRNRLVMSGQVVAWPNAESA